MQVLNFPKNIALSNAQLVLNVTAFSHVFIQQSQLEPTSKEIENCFITEPSHKMLNFILGVNLKWSFFQKQVNFFTKSEATFFSFYQTGWLWYWPCCRGNILLLSKQSCLEGHLKLGLKMILSFRIFKVGSLELKNSSWKHKTRPSLSSTVLYVAVS